MQCWEGCKLSLSLKEYMIWWNLKFQESVEHNKYVDKSYSDLCLFVENALQAHNRCFFIFRTDGNSLLNGLHNFTQLFAVEGTINNSINILSAKTRHSSVILLLILIKVLSLFTACFVVIISCVVNIYLRY